MTWKSCVAAFAVIASASAARFTLEQVMSAPFPLNLTVSHNSGRVAWVLDENGARNLWIAEAPDYKGRRLTKFTADDGQEIAEISWTPDGRSIIYTRGGDFETRRDNPNPASYADAVEQAIWIAPANGEAPRKLSEGNQPAVSPKGDRIVFLKAGQIWSMGLAPDAKPAQLIHAKGRAGSLRWSPDGTRVAFVNNRGDHAFVGVFDFGQHKLWYLDASADTDAEEAWSPDGKQIAFIRIPVSSRAFLFGPVRSAETPWSIRLADVESGNGRELWHASPGAGSAFHPIVADNQLFWGSGDRIVFPWEKTGYVHLYSLSTHGDNPTALNEDQPFEVEYATLSSDGSTVYFNSNQGDIDRRQLWRVPVTGGGATELTKAGLNWAAEQTGDGKAVAFIHSDERQPARAAVLVGNSMHDLAPEAIPADFPVADLVVPQPVIISAADGMQIHCQLFLPPNARAGEKHPAAIFFHGGSRRQMLLGWHYMDYYNHAYAMNQYLANRGYVVLAVNYRSGIGYGLNFREALNYGATGASEFNDVMGAGLYLRNRPDVNPSKIALWGGSYGGYLTALGLARASDLFAVGVDFHGVHDWNNVIRNFVPAYDPGKDQNAARLAYESSPMASVSTWRSPVLLIHGDDDRNVPFNETVRLVEALRKQGVEFEQLVFPDEIHGFLTHKRWLQAYEASAQFMDKHLK
ncbi:MAG TPA: prolyl oligopeptidase family serine peptidase [Bryobacteraceae bacterium]|nr:prolyl oligopeptidase family serine peptidase [Bryobacteraceae bacterium]